MKRVTVVHCFAKVPETMLEIGCERSFVLAFPGMVAKRTPQLWRRTRAQYTSVILVIVPLIGKFTSSFPAWVR
jgi:hypothetical protein